MPDQAPPIRRQLLETPPVIINPYRFTPPAPTYPAIIVDNVDAGFSINGSWSTASGGYGTNYRFESAGSWTYYAQWLFTGLDYPATYNVAATWVQYTNRATNAPYRINVFTEGEVSIRIDQTQAPIADYTAGGRPFQSLGNYASRSDNKMYVRVHVDANNYVIADAIRIQRVS